MYSREKLLSSLQVIQFEKDVVNSAGESTSQHEALIAIKDIEFRIQETLKQMDFLDETLTKNEPLINKFFQTIKLKGGISHVVVDPSEGQGSLEDN